MADSMIEQIRSNPGFIAALDQSGGSTPGALKAYGIPEEQYDGNEAEMFRLMHEMRVRVMTAPSFTGNKVVGAILFEKTMDGEANGQSVPGFLRERGIAPFLKIDKGLEPEADGVQLMKPIPGLDDLLARAVKLGVVGTKERSVIAKASPAGVAAIVEQQFAVGAQVAAHGIVPILEPEVLIRNPEKARSEELLRDEVARHLDADRNGFKLMLKITPPEQDDLYAPLMDHPRVVRIVALSGGYPRDEACAKVAANKGLIASFSRALLDDLRVSQDDAEFDRTLGGVIDQIYRASAHRN
ncbi:MAG: fructose bisphosphate aldolase [Gluconacetobacter diazotrophicus]|nr:fructose bisphosphate aldolase [Gluconacetobacter diazotrophicus]